MLESPEFYGDKNIVSRLSVVGDAMKDMRVHLEKMLVQVAECELIRDLATDPQKRELFDRLAQHHRELARHIELAIAARDAGDTFVGRKSQEPFPQEEAE